MSTRRRSLREHKGAKYDEESSDEDEEEGRGLDPKMKKSKKKPKEIMMDDVDAESDFEKEMLYEETRAGQTGSQSDDDFVGEEKENKGPPQRKKRSLGNQTLGKGSQIPGDSSKIGGGIKHQLGGVPQQRLASQNKGLNLSESDSSEDETLVENSTIKSAEKKALNPKGNILPLQPSLFDDQEEGNVEEEAAASQKLMALACNLELVRSAWVENPDAQKSGTVEDISNKVEKKKGGKRTVNKKKRNIVDQVANQAPLDEKIDISNLLFQGGEVGNDDEEETGETEERKSVVPKDGVEITVAVPEGLKRKKKKGFDVAAYIKRKIGKARREVALLQHQAHYVCMLAHLEHIDRLLNRTVLKAVALSMVPINHCRSPDTISLTGLASLVTWVKGRIAINTTPTSAPRTCLALLKAMETFVCCDFTELVLVFVLICRSLGYSARFVANLALISHKPTEDLKLAGDKSLKSNAPTEQHSNHSTENNDELKVVVQEEERSKKLEQGGLAIISGNVLPDIKVENVDETTKSEIQGEKPEKKERRSRSRKRSGLWETVLKSPDVKGESEALETAGNVMMGRSGKCEPIDISGKEVKSDKEIVGAGKRKSRSPLVTSPPKSEGESMNRETPSRRTSKRLSTAPFSTEKLKPKEAADKVIKKKGKCTGSEADSESDFEPSLAMAPKSAKKGRKEKAKGTPRRVNNKGSKNLKRAELESDDVDFEAPARKTPKSDKKIWCEQNQWFANRVAPKSKKSGKKSQKVWCDQENHWAEVFLEVEGRWVTVDLVEGTVDKPAEVQAHCSRPLLHVLAVEGGTVKDVTRRYTSNFHTEVRKLRTDAKWLEMTLAPFKCTDNEFKRDLREEEELSRKVNEAPLPKTIGEYKDHPLYALERHLLKFEKIYPPNAPTLGFTKTGEAVYARECVRTLNGRTHWLKEGRTVKVGELPYKVVKARPKWTRTPAGWIRAPDEDLDVFGEWQTKLFEAPPAVDGMVPRNEYGNVELFKPWMLPPGTVHVQETIPKYLVRRTGIDAAPAMIGWDFSGGGCHPVFDGLVVCKENEKPLREAWAKEQEHQERREEEKREKRVLDNWKKLVRGLVIKQKIKIKYMKD